MAAGDAKLFRDLIFRPGDSSRRNGSEIFRIRTTVTFECRVLGGGILLQVTHTEYRRYYMKYNIKCEMYNIEHEIYKILYNLYRIENGKFIFYTLYSLLRHYYFFY